jgi:hypothetical protein
MRAKWRSPWAALFVCMLFVASWVVLTAGKEELAFLRRDDVAGALQEKEEQIAALHEHVRA